MKVKYIFGTSYNIFNYNLANDCVRRLRRDVALKFFGGNRVTDKIILCETLFIVAFGSLSHFFFEWSNGNAFVGLFSPVNESVWEHLKLALYPTVLWWAAGYLLASKKAKVNVGRWMSCSIVSILVSCTFIVSFYYVMKGAFGVESMFIDILSFVIGVLFGQLVSLYVYRYTVLGRNCTVCSIVVILTMTFIFSVFTFFPPQVPLFHDKSTGIYGIYKDTN